MRKSSFLFFFSVLFLASAAFAISVEFSPERVEAGKPFEMRLIVPLNQASGAPQIVEAPGFQLQKLDSSQGVHTTNDWPWPQQYKAKIYSYHLLAPKTEGRHQIKTNKGVVSVTVERPYDAPGLGVLLTPNKKTAFVGEQIALRLTLLTYPSLTGGIEPVSNDLGQDFVVYRSKMDNLTFEPSERPGVRSEASMAYAWVAPLRAGALTLPGLQFKYQKIGAPKVVEKKTGNFSFRSVTQEPSDEVASTGTLALQVTALPEPAPAGFGGMVGSYTFSATLDKDTLQVGEAATITLKISGDGKPGTIAEPQIPGYSNFRTVPPEVKVTTKVQGAKLLTTKTLKIFLYPKKVGDFELAPIRFTWFDPVQKSYETQESPTWKLHVKKGEITEFAATGGTSDGTTPPAQKKEIETLGSDIRHIKQAEKSASLLYQKPWYWALVTLPWLALLLVWALQKRSKHSKPSALKALKVLEKRLRNAQEANEVANALEDYWNARGLTRDQLRALLQERGASPDTIAGVVELLDACDYARFAPDAQAEAQKLATRATEILRNL